VVFLDFLEMWRYLVVGFMIVLFALIVAFVHWRLGFIVFGLEALLGGSLYMCFICLILCLLCS
jgi:hypothetical protein